MTSARDNEGAGSGSDPYRAAASLLDGEFGDVRFRTPNYLRWLYDDNPDGPAVVGDRDDDQGRLAHYACVPQRWRNAGGDALLGITLDAVVRSGAQRRGVFSALAHDVFDRASTAGMQGTITVANANSTPAFLRNLGFAMVCPLPVVVRPALGRVTQVESATADDGLGKGWIDELAADAAAFTPHGWVRAWTAATLRWRLASPITQFSIHRGTDGWAIATLTHHARIPFAIIVKLIPRAPHDTLDAAMLATAACRFHKAPFALYAGMNAHGSPRGIPLPRRALPSPLNLLVRSFDPALDRSLLQTIDTYEFLDADHY